jgi:hypothetical protein
MHTPLIAFQVIVTVPNTTNPARINGFRASTPRLSDCRQALDLHLVPPTNFLSQPY